MFNLGSLPGPLPLMSGEPTGLPPSGLPYAGFRSWRQGDLGAPLQETEEFGFDPGGLRMLSFIPEGLQPAAPLVVVLHGCTQTAAGYDHGSGWSDLAQRHGFALLFPEQRRSNNPNLCFNWFDPTDTARGRGEVASVRSMVEHIVGAHGLDRGRVFVTGLSAGGAMTAALLATYPETFAAGAIIAGLPFGSASGVQQAFERMNKDDHRSATMLGEQVRQPSRHRGPWPRVSVWHGTADTTVRPFNARASVAQWLDVHGCDNTARRTDQVDGFPHATWVDGDGGVVVEEYSITGMGHGTPVGPRLADPEQRCGAAAPYMLDVGISSTYRIAEFFGVTSADRPARRRPAAPTSDAPPDSTVRGARFDVDQVIKGALRAAGILRD